MATFAIPTCDRPDLLRKSIASATRAITAASGIRRIIVLDDSRNPASQDATRRVVGAARKDTPLTVEYWGREEKKRLVRHIVDGDTTGVPERVVSFALLGADEEVAGTGEGGSRNTAFLASAGEPVVSMDDDARFEFLTLRGTRLSPDKPIVPIRDHDFGPEHVQGAVDTQRRFRDLAEPVELDVAAWIVSTLTTSHPGAEPNAHPLRAVMTGIAGNRWYERLEPPFHSRGIVRDVIYRRKRRYQRALKSGYALMQAKRCVATETPFFVPYCCGFDARDMLPPFPPDLLRPPDTVFTWFLQKFDRHGLIGHLPVMVRHDLGPRRPDGFRNPEAEGISVTEIVPGIIADVVNSTLPNYGISGLVETGHRLREIADVSPSDWIEYVHTIWLRSRAGTAVALERLLDQYNESPGYWAEDVSQYITALRAAAPNLMMAEDNPDWVLPLQRYMDNLGELLVWWPAIWNAASGLDRDLRIGEVTDG